MDIIKKVHVPPVTVRSLQCALCMLCALSVYATVHAHPSMPGMKTNKVKFIVIGDSHITTGENDTTRTLLEDLRDTILRREHKKWDRIDFILFTGDHLFSTYRISQETFTDRMLKWRKIMNCFSNDHGIKILSCRGNHEYRDLGNLELTYAQEVWKKVYTDEVRLEHGQEVHYAFALPQNGSDNEKGFSYFYQNRFVTVVTADQYMPNQDYRVNTEWLNSIKNSITTPHVFFFGHAPLIPAYKALDQALSKYPQQREEYLQIMNDLGVRSYFCGHEHFFNHAELVPVCSTAVTADNHQIQQVMTVSAGGSLRSWFTYPLTYYYRVNSPSWTPLLRKHINATASSNTDNFFGYTVVEAGDLDFDFKPDDVKITPRYFRLSNNGLSPLIDDDYSYRYSLSGPSAKISTVTNQEKLSLFISLEPGKDFLRRQAELWILMFNHGTWYQFFKNDPKNLAECWRSIQLTDSLTTFQATVKELASLFQGKPLAYKQAMEPGRTDIYVIVDLKVDNKLSLENHWQNSLFYDHAVLFTPYPKP
ncbi:MAG: metallophosphoesterase [Chitinivibrionales bacterium]|nr:metallophosphoesterase [Chitinivibrionales bacterium]